MSDDSSKDTLIAQLEKAPLTQVTGIVDANGAGGGGGPGDGQWTMTFSFVAWRQENGPMKIKDLIVRQIVSDDQLKSYMNSIEPDSIIRIRARVVEESIWDRPDALLDAVIGEYADDDQLNDLLAELKNPVVYKDARFGALTLDRTLNWYRGMTGWNRTAVELCVATDDSKDLQPALAWAHQLWSDSGTWDQQIRDRIARDLLPLKSQNWVEDDGSIVTRSEFESRMKLRSIIVFADGAFDVEYNDDDLFWGHDIVVYGSLKDGMKSANIQG